MTLYLWDTNTISDVIKGLPATLARFKTVSYDQVAISALTEAELHYGLARKPQAINTVRNIERLLATLIVLPWHRQIAPFYGKLRSEAASEGITVGSIDLLIAAHAYAQGRILVTNDKSLSRLQKWIRIEDWRA